MLIDVYYEDCTCEPEFFCANYARLIIELASKKSDQTVDTKSTNNQPVRVLSCIV